MHMHYAWYSPTYLIAGLVGRVGYDSGEEARPLFEVEGGLALLLQRRSLRVKGLPDRPAQSDGGGMAG